jgi:predicted alpha/beta-fold hydrolase
LDSDVVILVHGLAGCNQSGYMLRCSAKLCSGGLRVFRMDLRGCGAGLALARHPLHAGRSEDAGAVLEYVHALAPAARIHLIGFSMGANIVLKLAGELGASAPQHLASLMAICPPIDLALCTQSIQRGLNRLYDRRFANALVGQIGARNVLVPSAFTRPLTPRPFRLMDFDRLFTAPLGGFADVHDYYARASSGPVLSRIAVPTLIIAAASDPIVPVATLERASYSATTHLHVAPCGGHMGFVAGPGTDPDRRWMDWRVVDWVLSQTERAAATSSRQYPEWGHDTQLCPCH